MKCYNCAEELIWGGDHDIDDDDNDYIIVSNLTCPNCKSYVEVYHPKEKKDGQELSLIHI